MHEEIVQLCMKKFYYCSKTRFFWVHIEKVMLHYVMNDPVANVYC